ncbi:MAG: GxxExxY protein [Marinilabiliaceae bacterium]|jgi:GxxExxY protein|nr:GxxExxY protein [Marinilabiliaceae bacterium]
MTDIIYKQESYEIIGACMNVYNNLGPGFKEAIYQEALELEFAGRNIPYKSETKLRILFKGYNLSRHLRADFLCYDSIIVEIKSLPSLNIYNYKQVKNYLKATSFRLGILVNFGGSSLSYKRILNPL